nr:TonB-dependent receptor [Allomuricauda sp.]
MNAKALLQALTEHIPKNHFFLIGLLLCSFSYANEKSTKSKDTFLICEQNSITGTVTDTNGNPLSGVNVFVEGTSRGVISDFDGNYQIEASAGETLVFNSLGFTTREIVVGDSSIINVQLEEDILQLDDVVVVGYGTQRRSDVTGAIASVNTEQLEQRTPANVFEAIQGQIAGVQLNTGSGAPGSGASIRIRGTSTFNGGTDPLFILDGQPVDNIDNINPNDIQSIEVLKDGASAAIYGSRSANGVILVTTKRGEEGKTSINVNYVKSISKLRTVPVANAQERLLYDLLRNQQRNTEIDSLNQMWNINNNFQEIFFQDAIKDQINVSLSSGGKETKFYWNTGFLDQEGFNNNTFFQRLNTRLNIDHDFSDKVRLGVRMGLSYDETKNIDSDLERNLISAALIKAAYSPYINPDGSFLTSITSFRGRANLLDEFERMDLRFRNLRGNFFTYVEFDLFKGFKYRANTGADFRYRRNTAFFPEAVNGQNTNIDAEFLSRFDYNWVHESFFTYENEWGDHSVTGLFGLSWQKWGGPEARIEGQLANNLIPTLNNLGGLESIDLANTLTEDQRDRALSSIFGRVTYSYQGKYNVNSTFRRDGSSRFGPDNRYGFFPSIAIAWRFSEESFLDNWDFLNEGKLRFSSAITGNERINNRDFDFLLSNGNFYNGLNGIGLTNQLGNPAIQWEETKSDNIGLDLGFFNNRINLSLDYYVKNTSKLLANRPLPAYTGFNQTRVNLGEVENKGFELNIQAVPISTKDFSWSTNFNISLNNNEVVSIAGGVPIISDNHITQEGSPLASFYGLQINGIFTYDESNAFTPDGVQLTPNFDGNGDFTNYTLNGAAYSGDVEQLVVNGRVSGGGDYFFTDANGDFVINGDDRQVLGNPYPKYFGGWRNQFTYKNFDFSFLFDFQFDVEVFNDFYQTMANFNLNSWTPVPFIINNVYEGPGDETAIFPDGFRPQNDLRGTGASSYWVEEADFIKLRNVRLGYNFPSKWTQKLGVRQASLFATVNNAFVWTNYSGFDPEVSGDPTDPGNNALNAGVDNGRYPRGREFLLGLNLNF